MTDKIPQILQRKPGEPGGEKARVRGWLEGLTYESSNGGERGLMQHHIEQFTEKLAPLVAGALAACALAEHDAICTDCRAHIDTKKYVRCKRGAALERAAGGQGVSKHGESTRMGKCNGINASLVDGRHG